MKFKHGTRRRALEYEKDWVQRWKADKTFEKSVEKNPKSESYVFYDGPPFITGVPHHGTLLSSIIKDAVPRYWTMKGKRVERVWGWDSHGLPAENFVEKQLGITDRRDIGTKISLEEYITTARNSMVANSETWEGVVDRVGRWVDFKGAYKTMDKNYMESVWWGFKTLYEKGKIYEGYKVLMYDTKFATPVSKNEVTMDNDAYQTVTDPSVYIKFRLKSSEKKHQPLKKDAKVLFVCRANMGRSQIAKGFYNSISGLENADSAGIMVDTEYHPGVYSLDMVVAQRGKPLGSVVVMQEKGIDISRAKRKQLTKDLMNQYDLVVDLAEANEGRPIWLQGENVVHWTIDDIGEGKSDIRKTRDSIEARVKSLLAGNIEDNSSTGYINLLAWTTTPWTLPANTALAVNPELEYAEVELDGERFVVANELVEKVFVDEKHQPLAYTIIRTFPGSELVGKTYEPLFGDKEYHSARTIALHDGETHDYTVEAADYVSAESGTGIVHLAPAYGEEDFALAKERGIRVVEALDENGVYYPEVPHYGGMEVWSSNKQIAKDLKERGVVWKIDYIQHEYPFNPRSKQRIMYRAVPSWFYDVTAQKTEMFAENSEHINWFPEHLKHGRFEKNIEQAPDWNLSRDRFWASAMPVWEGHDADGKLHRIVVGSYDELFELSGQRLDDYHRPWVDAVEFDKDGVHYKRIEKVLDGWFESGSMPFAQFHYPFENKEKFEADFPGDFIAEYIGQVRAWFYYLHVVNVGLFGHAPFKNVITTGTLAGNDGRKMSKSLGNYTDPNELMDKFSADSLRFLLLSSPLLKGEDFSLQDKEVGDVARKLSMIWNMYDFFTMYAEVDEFTFPYDTASSDAFLLRAMSNSAQSGTPESLSRTENENLFPIEVDLEKLKNPLDKWIISRVHQLNEDITKNMDAYNIPDALAPVFPFLDDASNWFVRRSRRRFWKSEDDADKMQAYRTLHYVLLKLSVLLAPFTPFLAEELYQNLGGGAESVHLLDWPTNYTVDQLVLDDMARLREYINEGLSLRAAAGLKVRQPLASVTVPTCFDHIDAEMILEEELNVKEVITTGEFGMKVTIDEKLTPELKREGMMREVIRFVQNARKDAGLNVDDRIELALMVQEGDGAKELEKAIEEFSGIIQAETLTTVFNEVQNGYETTVKVDGTELQICLKKV